MGSESVMARRKAAIGGHTSVVMLVGENGIGKSRIAEERIRSPFARLVRNAPRDANIRMWSPRIISTLKRVWARIPKEDVRNPCRSRAS